MAKALGLSRSFGLLTVGALAVCGVSAAGAISTVLPKKDYQEKYFALTVIGITTLSTLAILEKRIANLSLETISIFTLIFR
jgi:uncharacterized membrane protein YadS